MERGVLFTAVFTGEEREEGDVQCFLGRGRCVDGKMRKAGVNWCKLV